MPELQVHGTVMKSVKSDTYLGDVISCDGSNAETIKSRVSKGNGIIAQIKNMLESVSLGQHYFKIALLLRESMLINGIITSAETWYGLKEREIDQLADIDHQFLRFIFEVPQSVPTCALFLETGSLTLKTIIKMRRVVFLHYLANLKEDEMLHKFFMAQWEKPLKNNEWTNQVKTDLIDFQIPVDLEFLKTKSSNAFKNFVKVKVRKYEYERLMEIKTVKCKSKMKNLYYSELKIQEYLELKEMNARQAKILFKFRVRMAPFGENYKGGLDTPPCPLCSSHPDTQSESFQCLKMKKLIDVKGEYSEIFGIHFPAELINTIENIYYF